MHFSKLILPSRVLATVSLAITLIFLTNITLAEEPESSGNVIIQDTKTDIVEELRINGQLYAIRITPKRGVPYYLVDSDGDGNLETRKNDTDPALLIPAWVIKRW